MSAFENFPYNIDIKRPLCSIFCTVSMLCKHIKMPESDTSSINLRDVILYTGAVERYNGEIFKEDKRRPAVVIWKHESEGEVIFLASPLNSSVNESWRGPGVRYCISPNGKYIDYSKYMTEHEVKDLLRSENIDFNNIRTISQVAVSNSFIVKKCFLTMCNG